MSQVNQAIDFSPILQPIQRNPAFSCFGVVLSLDGEVHVLKKAPALPGHAEYVVVEVSTDKYHPDVSVGKEAGLAAINCSAAVVAGVAVFGTAGAAPLTAGTSALLTGVAYTATLATGAACLNSIARTWNAINAPETVAGWDQSPVYRGVFTVVDGISLLGVAASVIAARKALSVLAKANVRIFPAIKGALNRRARQNITLEINRLFYPGISNKKMKALLRGGLAPKAYSAKAISEGSLKELQGAIASGLSFLGSGLDGTIREVLVHVVSLDE